jgi:hypothetical protein
MCEPITINQEWLSKNQNSKADDSASKQGLGYLDTSTGILRGVQVFQKGSRLAAEAARCARYSAPTLDALGNNLGKCVGRLGLMALPSTVSSAYDSLSALTVSEQEDGINVQRKLGNATKNVADVVSYTSSAISYIQFNPLARTVSAAADLIGDSTDLTMSWNDYSKASSLEAQATDPDVKEVCAHSKKYNFYRLLKNIGSVAGAILGLSLFVMVIPPIVLIALSLATTLLAITKDFISLTGKHKVIKFDSAVRV